MMDLGNLFDKPKKKNWDAIKVFHKESGEIRLIKSSRFDPRFHSMNIPGNAKENLDLNHPNPAIVLTQEDVRPVQEESVPSTAAFKEAIKVLESNHDVAYPVMAVDADGLALKKSSEEPTQFPCSKCAKLCASNAGRVAHERKCLAQNNYAG